MSDQTPSDKVIDPRSFSFGVVAARYNESLVEALLERVTSSLCEDGQPAALVVERVPGSHEIPSAMSLMIEARPFSCLVGLGW